jgi:hypothetical protein
MASNQNGGYPPQAFLTWSHLAFQSSGDVADSIKFTTSSLDMAISYESESNKIHPPHPVAPPSPTIHQASYSHRVVPESLVMASPCVLEARWRWAPGWLVRRVCFGLILPGDRHKHPLADSHRFDVNVDPIPEVAEQTANAPVARFLPTVIQPFDKNP